MTKANRPDTELAVIATDDAAWAIAWSECWGLANPCPIDGSTLPTEPRYVMLMRNAPISVAAERHAPAELQEIMALLRTAPPPAQKECEYGIVHYSLATNSYCAETRRIDTAGEEYPPIDNRGAWAIACKTRASASPNILARLGAQLLAPTLAAVLDQHYGSERVETPDERRIRQRRERARQRAEAADKQRAEEAEKASEAAKARLQALRVVAAELSGESGKLDRAETLIAALKVLLA